MTDVGLNRISWKPQDRIRPGEKNHSNTSFNTTVGSIDRRAAGMEWYCETDGALLVQEVRSMVWMGRRSSLLRGTLWTPPDGQWRPDT